MELIQQNAITQNRSACLDYARILAVLLVIYGHLYDPNPDNFVRVFIYQFHMPFFFFVSGMLHKYNGAIQFKKYAKTLLIPVLFFSLVCFFYLGLLYHIGFEYKKDVDITGKNLFETYANYFMIKVPMIIHGLQMPCGPTWFLVALFYCKIFHDFLCKHLKIGALIWCMMFILICYNKHRELFVANAVTGMPFYFIGYCLKNKLNLLTNLAPKIKVVLIIIMLCLIYLIAKYNGMVSSFSILFSSKIPRWKGIPLFYLSGFSGSLMLLTLASFFQKSSNFSTFLGNALISFLGFQMVFIYTMIKTVGINRGYIVSIWIALAIFVACIPFHWVVTRFAPCLLGKSNNK